MGEFSMQNLMLVLRTQRTAVVMMPFMAVQMAGTGMNFTGILSRRDGDSVANNSLPLMVLLGCIDLYLHLLPNDIQRQTRLSHE